MARHYTAEYCDLAEETFNDIAGELDYAVQALRDGDLWDLEVYLSNISNQLRLVGAYE